MREFTEKDRLLYFVIYTLTDKKKAFFGEEERVLWKRLLELIREHAKGDEHSS